LRGTAPRAIFDDYAGVSARILNFLSRQLDRLGKAESAIQINR